jgi:hypothetical protein
MANHKRQPIPVPSESVEDLFNVLSAMPPLTHCRKCGSKLFHLDATFLSDSGKTWTLPLPFCSRCHSVECLAEHAA